MALRRRSHLVLVPTLLITMLALAGCARGNADHGRGSGSASLAGLTVHIGLFGGPARLGGGMALSHSPAQMENVTAVDEAGHEFVAQTDEYGVATLHLAAGPYTVFSTGCGDGRHHVVLTTTRITRVQIHCAIP